MKILAATALLAALPLLGACSDHSQPGNASTAANAPADGAQTVLGRKIQEEIGKAQQKLRTENIDISSMHVSFGKNGSGVSVTDDDHRDRPKAEITPQGDLLVEGKAVPVDAAQRALLVEYRNEVVGIASAGMAIGAQGADIGMSAAKQAIVGALFGKDDKAIEASIKPQADRIKAAARKLCLQLPAMRDTQQRLAAALPAFKPYATLDQDDIDDCMKDDDDDHTSAQAGEVRGELHEVVREANAAVHQARNARAMAVAARAGASAG